MTLTEQPPLGQKQLKIQIMRKQLKKKSNQNGPTA